MASDRPLRRGRREVVATLVGTAAIGAVAVVGLRPSLGESFWRDEAATATVQHRGAGELWRLLAHEEGGLAAYHLVLRPWTAATGTGETALRLPSLAAALATLVAAALLGRRLGGVAVGLGAAALLALHPTFLPVYAVEARPPATASATVAAAALVAHRLSRDGGRRRRWLWSGLAAASVALSLMSVLAVTPLVAWVLRRPGGRTAPALAAAGGLPAVALLVTSALAARDRHLQSWITPQPLAVVRDLGHTVLGPAALWVAAAAAACLGALAVAAAIGSRWAGPGRGPERPPRRDAVDVDGLDVAVLLGWWVGPLVVLVAWTEVAVPAFTPRYVLPSAAGGAVAAAALAGLAVRRARPAGGVATALVGTALLLGAAVGLDRARDAGALARAHRLEDLRAAAALVASDAPPEAAVLYAPTWAEAGVRWYLAERPGAPPDPPPDVTAGARSAEQAGSLWTPPTGIVEARSRLVAVDRVWIVGSPGDRTWEPVPEVGHPLAAEVRRCWVRVASTDLGIVVEEWVPPVGRPRGGACP